jgi:hypothetical protein
MPFLDAEFMRIVASVPIDLRYFHAFYNRWLEYFPEYVANTCWQAYPGHVPCPVPSTRVLARQWDVKARSAGQTRTRRKSFRWALKSVTSRNFASSLLKRHVVLAAGAMHASGVRNCSHLLIAAKTIQNCWTKCIVAPETTG